MSMHPKETLLGYLIAIWFNSMWDNHTGHWLQPETILTYLEDVSGIYLIAISQEATINYNMCSCSWSSFSGPKKLKIVQIIGNWKPCKVCGWFHQPILTGEMCSDRVAAQSWLEASTLLSGSLKVEGAHSLANQHGQDGTLRTYSHNAGNWIE